MKSQKPYWHVAACVLACFVVASLVMSAAADDKKNKSTGTTGSKSSSGMSGSKKSAEDKPKSKTGGDHKGVTSSSGGSARTAPPADHEHTTPSGTSGPNPRSSTPGVIIRSGGPGYVPGSTNIVPAPSSSGPTVIQRNFPPTAPVANSIPGQPLSVAPNEIPAGAAPGNEIPAAAVPANGAPGAFDPMPPDQRQQLCARLLGVVQQTGKQLDADPIGSDADVLAARDRLLSALNSVQGDPRKQSEALTAGFEEIKKVADAKVAAGTYTAAQRDAFNSKIDTANNAMQGLINSCRDAGPGGGSPPAAPGGGTPPPAGNAPAPGTPVGNPPAPTPMPANPTDPVTIYINIVDPIIIIEDPLIDDGIILAIDPGTVVIGTGGEGDLTVIEGTAEDLGIPCMDSEPIPEADAGLTGGCGVILNNPKSSRGKVNYTLDGKSFSMEPGYTHELPGGRTYLLEFDKGGTFGKARYSLAEGTYDFGVGSQGWDVFSKTYEAILDNSGNSTDFNYVRDDQRFVVKAREQQTLTGKCPILIIFDQGHGGDPARRVLREGTYTVGVDTSTRLLDLFREDAPAKIRADGPKPAPASVPAPVPAPVPSKPQP